MTGSNPTRTTTASTRKDLLGSLAEFGYTGPTSFTAAVLRRILDWVRAGILRTSQTTPRPASCSRCTLTCGPNRSKLSESASGGMARSAASRASLTSDGDAIIKRRTVATKLTTAT